VFDEPIDEIFGMLEIADPAEDGRAVDQRYAD
jgi:hypothetical protein